MKNLSKKIKPLLILFSLFIITACSSPNINDYSNSAPDFDVMNYFSGELEAKGVVINRSGLVTRRFSVKMLGTLEGNKLTLEEWFIFDDGEKTERTWVISQLSEGQYTGRAGDIVGTAEGESQGITLAL